MHLYIIDELHMQIYIQVVPSVITQFNVFPIMCHFNYYETIFFLLLLCEYTLMSVFKIKQSSSYSDPVGVSVGPLGGAHYARCYQTVE